MENRFQHNPPEGQEGWGAYASPPIYSSTPGKSNPGKLCVDVRKLLPELLENDGSIRPEMASAIYGHLAICPDCARELDEMQQLVARIDAMPQVDLPMDYSELVMRKIQTQTRTVYGAQEVGIGQAAVRQVTKAIGTQTQTTVETVTQTGVTVWQRLTLGALLSGILAFFLSSAWGRQMLGATAATTAGWLEQVGDMAARVPVLSGLIGLIVLALSQAGQLLLETYQSLGGLALEGLGIDIALGALIVGVVRRNNRQRVGV